jgi:membrane protease YdiL (CAAX protease family)
VGSAILFGLAHFEALQLAALILFGLILGTLAYRTGRLGPTIVAHAAFNAVTVLTLTLNR